MHDCTATIVNYLVNVDKLRLLASIIRFMDAFRYVRYDQLNDADITGKSSDEVARRGIARTFQAVNVFKEETVRENLRRSDVLARCHNPFA